MLDEQSKVYKVEGVDESAPAAPQKKRKQHINGEEVRILNPLGQCAITDGCYVCRSNLPKSPRKRESTLLFMSPRYP